MVKKAMGASKDVHVTFTESRIGLMFTVSSTNACNFIDVLK